MKTILSLFTTLLLICSPLYGQSARIEGTVTSGGEPVAGANAGIQELMLGQSTDRQGRFIIREIPAGTHQLSISALGFLPVEKTVTLEDGETKTLEIVLEASPLELGQVVVTGTMKETFVKDSPVKVNVVAGRFLDRSDSNNLMEGISYINGLNEQVSCGVCGTSNIRINGMKGPYTAVLIDGMPIMGSLASVYGLDGISSNMIESIEIIKGPNSTLYGSEAMGGVINVRTKDPQTAPLLATDINGSSHGEGNFDFTYAPKGEGFSTLIGGNIFHFDRFLDRNGDNFADITQRSRYSLFNKWTIERKNGRTFQLAGKVYYEDRVGGTERYTREMRGSSEIYGEAIETRRYELIGSYQLPIDREPIRFDFSLSRHFQNSYYGDYHYRADQQTYYGSLIWDNRIAAGRELLIGATTRYDRLAQEFNAIRLENTGQGRFIPGLFAQYEHIFNDTFKGLAGLRVDHHRNHGAIASPRLNLKADLTGHTTLRLNAGTGFRIVNLFTEEHEALTGSRQVVITEDLNPERSYNGALNLNQIVDIGTSVVNIDLDLFYTHFTNQIIPDYRVENQIRYSNLDGYARTRGISLSAAHNFPGPLEYSVGITYQKVTQTTDGIESPLPYSPELNGVFSLSYAFTGIATSIDYTGRIVGTMQLPQYDGYASRSTPYTEQNIRIGKSVFDGMELYFSVKNLLNYTQKNPIVAADRPFSDAFATDRVYGPTQGRRIMIGLKYDLK